MSIAISPRHVVPPSHTPMREWTTDYKIEIFLARIDGWHLEVADRCINGWKNPDGAECINAVHRGMVMNHVPDAGWAVLQIVLNYFEVIGRFKVSPNPKKERDFHLFTKGFEDVFPEFKGHDPSIPKLLWGELRGGLYHSGVKSGRIFLGHTANSEALHFDRTRNLLVIDPHRFVVRLRAHLEQFGQMLKDPSQSAARTTFETAFDKYYNVK